MNRVELNREARAFMLRASHYLWRRKISPAAALLQLSHCFDLRSDISFLNDCAPGFSPFCLALETETFNESIIFQLN